MRALDDAERLIETTTNGPVDGTRTAIEISLNRDVGPLAAEYATSMPPYRRRIRLEPAGGPDQRSVKPENVNDWAEQTVAAIRRLKSLPGVEAVDVFMATPIGFAVALGWRLNAIGGVCLFHPGGNVGPYELVWTTPDS